MSGNTKANKQFSDAAKELKIKDKKKLFWISSQGEE
jgi:hypothetical protein